MPCYPVSGIIVIEQLLKPLIDHWLKAPAATDICERNPYPACCQRSEISGSLSVFA